MVPKFINQIIIIIINQIRQTYMDHSVEEIAKRHLGAVWNLNFGWEKKSEGKSFPTNIRVEKK